MTATPGEPPTDEWPGWADAFAAICDRHRGRLVRWLTTIFGARDAEDIAQEALARLYARPELLDEEADPWPWLAVVARNVGRDMARHNAYSTAVDSATLEQLPDSATVAEAVVARDEADRLGQALRHIGARDRALLHLRDIQGVAVTDIAEQLGMNDNAVRQQLFRARRRLANVYLTLGGERRIGLVALAQLRLREFARRHGRLAELLGPASSGVLATALPTLAAIVSGVIYTFVTAGDAGRTAAGGEPRAEPVPAYGVAGRGGPSPGPPDPRGVRRDGPPPGPTPYATLDESVGPVKARGWTRDPFDPRKGRAQEWQIVVDVPVVGPVTVTVGETSGNPGPVCRRVGCPTAMPTTPAPTPRGSTR